MAERKTKSSKSNSSAKTSSNSLSGAFKKIMSAGNPADMSKELLHSAVGQMNKTKDDVTARVTSEIIALIRKIDFVKEFSKFAEDHKFKISAEIEVIKKEKK